MTTSHQFHTPVGRFVSGSLTEKRTHDGSNRPIEPDKQRFEFGLAIAKNDPGLVPMLQGIAVFAKSQYAHAPHVATRIDQWFQTLDGFSMKVSDGDKPNTRGEVNKNMAGHFVIWFSSSFPPLAANAQNQQIDAATIKRGWYVDVAATCAVNGLTDHNAGIYMNPTCVRLIAEGEEILGGMTVENALANAPAAPTSLPPGARPLGSMPTAPASSGPPGTGLPGANPTTAPATMPTQGVAPGAPGGLPGMGAAAPGGSTASPGNYPAHPGILGGGLPQ
jgi:hypothetical protein